MSSRLLRERLQKPAYLPSDELESPPPVAFNPHEILARPINENNQFDFFQQSQQKLLYRRQNVPPPPGVPGVGHKLLDMITRVKMALLCGIESEGRWALEEICRMTHESPSLLNLRDHAFIEEPLVALYTSFPYVYEIPFLTGSNMQVENALDAAVALRNLCQDTANAYILAQNLQLREAVITAVSSSPHLTTPQRKMAQYTVDMVEAISSYISPAPKDDPLFVSLVKMLGDTPDRGVKNAILRALSRLLVRLKTGVNRSAADNVTSELLDFACLCLLMENDPEFIVTALDFLYQYILPGGTRVVNLLKSSARCNLLVFSLPKLLVYKLTPIKGDVIIQNPETFATPLELVSRVETPAPEIAKLLPKDIFESVDALPEPQRATMWMRCCFRAAPKSDVTQILLWKLYELQFLNEHKKLLPAVDFIKNVTNAFPESAAMVVTENGGRKFIIKGIEPRPEPVLPLVASTEGGRGKLDPHAKQRPVDLWSGAGFGIAGEGSQFVVSEIGKNAAMFINGLGVQERGKALVRVMERDLVDVLARIPEVAAILEISE